MALYRFQTSIQAKTEMSKDRYVTTFYVDGPGAADATGVAPIETAIQDFWTLSLAGGNNTAHYLSPSVSGQLSLIKSYAMADPTPREPIHELEFSMSPNLAPTDGLPAEVACCLSFSAGSYPLIPTPRKRGRVFVGPLATNVLGAEAVTGSIRPTATFRQHLIDVAVRMALAINTASGGIWRWCIHSPTTGPDSAFTIDKVSVDDAFDTQRNRGVAPSSKLIGTI